MRPIFASALYATSLQRAGAEHAAFALDWNATAIGTLALAIVTAVALVIGWLTFRQTKDEIAAADAHGVRHGELHRRSDMRRERRPESRESSQDRDIQRIGG
jgi:hypothetical protein